MSESADLPSPMMSASTGLHAYKARRQLLEKTQQLAATKLAATPLSTFRINAVNLKNVLRKVQTDCGNLHGGRLLSNHAAPISAAVHPLQQSHYINVTARNRHGRMCPN